MMNGTKFLIALTLLILTLLTSCGGEKLNVSELGKQKKILLKEIKKIDSLMQISDTAKKEVFFPLVEQKQIKTERFLHETEVLGVVSSDKNIILSAEYNGKITNVFVKDGQKVYKGQKIIELDGKSLRDNESEIKTQLKYAQYMLDKQKILNEKGVGSEFDLKQAENQVNSLKIKLKSLNTMKGKTIVVAPFSGVVEDVMSNVGEFVGAGTPIARIVNISNVNVIANVSEKLLKNLKEGKQGTEISIKFDNLKKSISTKIHTLGKYVDPVNRTIKIRANIDNNKTLLPNMTGVISIIDFAIDSANVIPTTSILKDEKNKDYIYILDQKKDNETYSVKKIYIDILGSYRGQSAISSKENLIGKRIVDKGAKGISEKDIVKLKL